MMKLKTLVSILLCLFVAGAAIAQVPEDKAKKSEEVLSKVRKLQLLEYLQPMLMTKEQIKQILPELERGRKLVKDQQIAEANSLITLDARVQKAIDASLKNGTMPDTEALKAATNMFLQFEIKRKEIAATNIEKMLVLLEKILDKGQVKSAANSLDSEFYPAGVKVETLSDRDRLSFFVSNVIYDPQAYALLIELGK